MRAKEYISYNKDSLVFAKELIATIDRFFDLRNNYSRTSRCYNAHLSDPIKWEKFIEKCTKQKINANKHWDFIQELEKCISTDLSFYYLRICLNGKNKAEKNLFTSEQINQFISNQYENYPCNCIDDYLVNDINNAFIKTIDGRNYTEKQELEIFSTAYYLFDKIRQDLLKVRHATHIYKEHHMDSEQMKDDVLRLLSFYIHDYNYNIEDFQRDNLNVILDELSKYIQRRSKYNALNDEAKERWISLKTTLDNMISDEEKIKLLISERTEFLQLSPKEQMQIDSRFAEKCQMEIDKIKQLKSVSLETGKNESNLESKEQKRTLNVTTETIFLLLKKIKVTQNADNTSMAAFISYLTGFSMQRIRQRLSQMDELKLANKVEVDEVNKLLNKLNISESITYSKR